MIAVSSFCTAARRRRQLAWLPITRCLNFALAGHVGTASTAPSCTVCEEASSETRHSLGEGACVSCGSGAASSGGSAGRGGWGGARGAARQRQSSRGRCAATTCCRAARCRPATDPVL